MPDEQMGTEAAGFAEPDDHPVAGLSVDAGVSRWTTTRIEMIDAIQETRVGEWLHLDALGALADSILARLPEAGGGADLRLRLRHAEAALIGDNEGCRLWMLDCAALVEKHRARANAAEAELAAAHARLRELVGPLPGDPGWSLAASGDAPPSLAEHDAAVLPRMARELADARRERDEARTQLAILTKGDR